MKKKQRTRAAVPQWLRWILFAGGALCMGTAIATAVLWMNFESLVTVHEWAAKYPTYLLLTALIYALVVYVLGAAIGRLWLSGMIVGVSALLLALVDYFKTAINGTPLSLTDFGLAAQLGEVAGVAGDLTPPVDFWRALTALLVCGLLLFLFRKLTVLTGRVRFLSASIALAALIGLFTPGCAEMVGSAFSVDVYARMPAASNNRTYGLTIALWRDSVIQSTPEPEGYSGEYMRDVLSRIDELLLEEETAKDTQADTVRPNIIMVLSEAFFDLTRLPDLTYERDPLENFHALEAESVSGTFYSHYLGYGTGYIEMAMHYGVTNKDFGPSTNICFMEDKNYQYFDALPEQFTKDGTYRAEMLHGYNDSLYNRTVTYPMLGYDQLMFSADIQNMGIEWSGSVYGGYYLKDSYLFRGMLDKMEEINAGGQRAFLFGITMENHQPFDPEKFGYQCQIGVESEVLSEEDMAITRVMLEGVTRADQALGKLVEDLRASGEPTVVVFFGDHRPNLFLTDGETIYTKYGLSPSNETTEWTAEQVADLYSTDYLIWANDAALLADCAGTEKNSSVTAIGPQLLKLLGQERSRYWALLGKVSETALSDVDLYFVDPAGRVSRSPEEAELTADQRELLALREAVIYDAFYGQQYITAQMNLPAGS